MAGRAALADSALLTLLLSAASPRLSANYALLVLRFCDRLFHAAERGGGELRPLYASLDGLAGIEPARLARWLGELLASLSERPDDAESGESRALLQSLTAFLVCEDGDGGGTLTGRSGRRPA